MPWLRKLLSWLFKPSLALLEAKASEYGTLRLEQVHNGGGLEWWCELRASGENDPQRRRYAWKGHGATLHEAITDALDEAKGHPIGAKPVLEIAPKLGGREFDPPR